MIAADDRGFALGDGLFETLLARDGALVAWDGHMARLERGCAALGLPTPDLAACREAAQAALVERGRAKGRAAVRLSWTAGQGGRGLDRPPRAAPVLAVVAAAAPAWSGPLRMATVTVRRNEGSPGSRMKTLSYLDNVLARREAAQAGAAEALMLNNRGEVACAAAANLFWLSGRTLMTPALECGVLDGVLRGALIARARADGWSVQAVRAGPEALDGADAVFLTNSLIGVRPVGWLDGRVFEAHGAIEALSRLVEDLA